MKLLILGGTYFLGRHITRLALQRGWDVTLFHRGKHGADLFPEAKRIIGDRNSETDKLAGGHWDAVIDTSAYFPRQVRASADVLQDATELYIFISSISVYDGFEKPGMDEDSPVATIENPEAEEKITGKNYGALKALCEQYIQKVYQNRALIVRPGFIVGPHDPSDRFTYWPWRVRQGGDILCPGKSDTPQQIIDVRDLAEWLLDLAEKRVNGVFNATGPESPYFFDDFLQRFARQSQTSPRYHWAPDSFIEENQVNLPLWLPEAYRNLSAVDISRAMAARLTFRPLEETSRDTLAWVDAQPEYKMMYAMEPEKEKELIRKLTAPESVE